MKNTPSCPAEVPGIHEFERNEKAWMAGTSPAMTEHYFIKANHPLNSPHACL
jgi:hypothetical protein